ncbi:hypothetical protein L6452_32301 [Arctium lappa]|uniref:Uncharacterized protein n=1 Tax=Arctium lappa TaxID=4217 RepID=A0ACB8Z8H0_ARCLA|nr:hypothetical protein L6452_32301 [Arctium lappa]
MALNTNTNYYDNGSLSKPPRFSRDNFSLWKNRMMLFLKGADPTIPEYIENGPYEPVRIIVAIPATATTKVVPERYVVKEIRQWSDEDKKKVGIDVRAKTIISMDLPDKVFHSIMHLKTSKEMWETICVQYEGTTEIQETRKINLLDSESDDLSDPDLSEFDESLALLTNSFKIFARKSNFRRNKPLSLTEKPKSTPVDKATATCYKCEKIGHFASECRSKKVFKPSISRRSSDDKYLKMKNKYQKLKIYKRKGKGLIAEEHDWAESEESSSDEEEVANLCLMAEIKEEVEELSEPSMSYISSRVSISTNPSLPEAERSRVVDVLTIDLYNALNDKTQAENKNVHLTQVLEKCHQKIRELTLLEEKLKDQDEPKEESSMLKFGTFVTPISDTSHDQFYPSSSNSIPEEKSKGSKSTDKGKSILRPQKATKKAKLKVPSKPSVNQSSSSVIEIFDLCPPKLKIDLKPTRSEEMKIPPRSHEKSILGPGPAHLKLAKPSTSGPKTIFKYRKCYHCGFTDHIASKCPTATKADKSAKVKMNASKAEKVTKAEKSTKVKNTTKVKKLTKVKITTEAESSSAVKIIEPSISTNPKGPIEKWAGIKGHLLTEYKEEKGPSVTFGGNGKGYTRGFGVLSNGTTTFRRVAYVDGLKHNLLSISQLCDKDYEVRFSKKACSVASTDVNWLWHKRLSHLNFKTLNSLSSKELVSGLPQHSYAKEYLCSACEKEKQTKASFKSKQVSSVTSRLQLLHIDLFGPVNIQSIAGKKYTLVIVDEFSRYTWVIFLHCKSDTPEELISFVKKMEVLNNLTVRSIRIDHGTEFKNISLNNFFENKVISHNFSSVRTPQQNGVTERRNRTIIDAARSMLSDSHLPTQFLGRSYQLGKFDPKADDGIFLGYSSISKAYRVFNKRRQSVEETIHVTFDETRSANSKPIADNEELNAWMFSHYRETEPFFSNHQHTDPPTADDDPNIIHLNVESNSWVSAEPLNTLLPSDLPSSENLSDNNSLSTPQ